MIMKEAISRGHEVTAIVRNAAKITDSQVTVLERDILEISYADVKEFDILVDAFNAPHGQEELHQTSLAHLTKILAGHKTPRLIVVGGAGSLYVDPTENDSCDGHTRFSRCLFTNSKQYGYSI